MARKLDVKGMLLLLNKVPPGTDLGALIAEAETAFNVKVATTLPLSSDVARAGSGGVFCVQRPDHPFSRGIADLMKQMNGVVSRHG